MCTMKNIRFGVEIEFTGIDRQTAADVLTAHFGVSAIHEGGAYDRYLVEDSICRDWTVMSDSSLTPEYKVGGKTHSADDTYRCELVTPVCEYEDIEEIQQIIRKLRDAGAFTNSSCGIHIHVDKAIFNVKTLKNLLNIAYSKQDLIYRALGVSDSRSRYCQKLQQSLLAKVKTCRNLTLDKLADIWYGEFGDSSRTRHYNNSRYHLINLHAFFNGRTVEFRCFNSTLHAGKVKAYIQFVLAVANQAVTQRNASQKVTYTDNPRYTFRCWLLRLDLIGEEFKTCRKWMLDLLPGNAAWRSGHPPIAS